MNLWLFFTTQTSLVIPHTNSSHRWTKFGTIISNLFLKFRFDFFTQNVWNVNVWINLAQIAINVLHHPLTNAHWNICGHTKNAFDKCIITYLCVIKFRNYFISWINCYTAQKKKMKIVSVMIFLLQTCVLPIVMNLTKMCVVPSNYSQFFKLGS